jgi:phosphopentomutase
MKPEFSRVAVVVVDGLGAGEAHDTGSGYPEDRGANSLVNASRVRPLETRGLQSMGIEHIPGMKDLQVKNRYSLDRVFAAFGALEPSHKGNGSPEGHQALMGSIVRRPFDFFDKTGFPKDLVADVEKAVSEVLGRPVEAIRYPGTDDISGTVFINHPSIGQPHLLSKHQSVFKLPIYASSDSLIQIALHRGVVNQEMIETIGKAVRETASRSRYKIARIIMRPFRGPDAMGEFIRISEARRDYGVNPDHKALPELLNEKGIPVHGIGKAPDMLNHKGFDKANCAKYSNDDERARALLEFFHRDTRYEDAFAFVNLIETDEKYGHRRNPAGYMDHLNWLGDRIFRINQEMDQAHLLIITSDHGCDPTWEAHTNHTRERVPLLVTSPVLPKEVTQLGVRNSFADIAKTVAQNYGVASKMRQGKSFMDALKVGDRR